jgi:hypothetical protein
VLESQAEKDEMGKWDDRVANHAVNGLLTTVLVALENLPAERVEKAPADVERLVRVVTHVRDRATRTPPELVIPSALNNAQQQLSSINTELTHYASSGNIGHLDNANNYADTLLEFARLLPPLTPDDAVAAAEADVARLREVTAAARRDAASARDTFAEESQGAERHVQLLESQVEALSKRLEEALAVQQAQFDEAEKARAAAAQEEIRKAENMFEATDSELQQNAEGVLQELRKLHKDAEGLVGAIGVNGVAAGYNEAATNEHKIANKWRIVTVAVAAVSALFLGSALFIDHGSEGSVERLVTRLVVALSFAGVAAYCGRQSAEHRKVERDARTRHLQLAALNPYLANMPESELVRLKGELAPGYFSPVATAPVPATGPGEDSNSTSLVTPAQLAEFVKTLTGRGTSA